LLFSNVKSPVIWPGFFLVHLERWSRKRGQEPRGKSGRPKPPVALLCQIQQNWLTSGRLPSLESGPPRVA